MERSAELVDALTRVPRPCRLAFDRRAPRGGAAARPPGEGRVEALAARGIVGGCDISAQYPSLATRWLVCATETRTREDVAAYARAFAEIMQNAAGGLKPREDTPCQRS